MDIINKTNHYYGLVLVDTGGKINNLVEIKKGTRLPVSKKFPIYAWSSETKYIKMSITESAIDTANLEYVKIICNVRCLIPKTTYSGGEGVIFEIIIDQDGIVKCEFTDGKNGTVLPHENIDDNNKQG